MDYVKLFESIIATGNYNLESLTERLDTMYIEGKLSKDDRDALLDSATNSADDSAQVDLFAKIVDLEHRVYALETDDIPVWVSGYTTNKGEVVKFDYDGDGEYDLLRYDGGRSYTSLSPGKIDGWHVVDSTGAILGTYYKGEFTPVSE